MGLFRREAPSDDDRRTKQLLDYADVAFNSDVGSGFENVVMEGLMADRAVGKYPPDGHSYPSKD
jgi:hypothetical protein